MLTIFVIYSTASPSSISVWVGDTSQINKSSSFDHNLYSVCSSGFLVVPAEGVLTVTCKTRILGQIVSIATSTKSASFSVKEVQVYSSTGKLFENNELDLISLDFIWGLFR